MITKQTALNQIQILSEGYVQIRIELSLVENDNKLSSIFHRAVICPGENIDTKMARINSHLSDMTYPSISSTEIDSIKSHCNLAWTPANIAKYQASLPN